MTPQEALHEISTMVYRNTDDFEMRISKDCYKSIISALEKQIPKKPIWDMGWVCPNCKHAEILHFPKRPDWDDLFCKKCGQALDWSDSE